MKNILILFTLLLTNGFYNEIFSQTSKLNFELVPKDELEQWVDNYGFSQLDTLAESGDAVAQRRLARFYDFIKYDNHTALKWYKKGAANGDFWAQLNLGKKYYDGQGVKRDLNKSLDLYKEATIQDPTGYRTFTYLNTIKNRDWIYNFKTAWAKKNAPSGNPIAQYYLAQAYEYGIAKISKDDAIAKKWYQLSANQGYEPAISTLKKLSETGNKEVDVIEVVSNDEVEVAEVAEVVEVVEVDDDENKFVGIWLSETDNGIMILHLDPEGFATIKFEQRTIGGKEWVYEGEKAIMTYEINTETSPTQLDIIITKLESGQQDYWRGIIKLVDTDFMKFATFYKWNGDRPTKFSSEFTRTFTRVKNK